MVWDLFVVDAELSLFLAVEFVAADLGGVFDIVFVWGLLGIVVVGHVGVLF